MSASISWGAVEHQPERQQPQLREFGEHREVIAQPPVRPAHPVGAIGHQGIESCRRHRAEPLVGTVSIANPAQVNGFRPAVDDDIRRGLGILCGNSEFTSVVVTGACRDDSQRNVGARQHLQRVGDDAVTAGDHDGVGAFFERRADQITRVFGAVADDFDDFHAAVMQPGDRGLRRCDGAPCPDTGLVSAVTLLISRRLRSVTESACRGSGFRPGPASP